MHTTAKRKLPSSFSPVKAKLRAALSLMWDAELHLRLSSPEHSLPFQHKILKLLKEISNDSRIYVHRTGFDAPPVKEEKRLTGELHDINPRRREHGEVKEPDYPHIRRVIPLLEYRVAQSASLNEREERLLRLAGTELATAALQAPGQYLEALGLLHRLLNDELPTSEYSQALQHINQTLLSVLPPGLSVPVATGRLLHDTDKKLLNKLEEAKND